MGGWRGKVTNIHLSCVLTFPHSSLSVAIICSYCEGVGGVFFILVFFFF